MTARARAADDRPALVFLHGFAMDSRIWRRQVEAFGKDYRLLLVDLPGFGPQAREVGEIEIAKEVKRAMDAAHLGTAHVIASAFGAAVAIDLALQFPDRIASLVLASPMLLGRKLGIESWQRCVGLANDGDRATAAEMWLEDPLFESLRHSEELFDEVRAIVLDYMGHHWTGKVQAQWADPDPMPRLSSIKIPTLIVSGGRDLPAFTGMAEAYVKAMPNARREVIETAGHHVNLEASQAFNTAMKQHLAQNR
ncbi:MAG: alpha/beta fold hydrolase [Labilithrix sp.]